MEDMRVPARTDSHRLLAHILRCPDCSGSLDPSLRCAGCGRSFLPDPDGIVDALPGSMERSSANREALQAAIERAAPQAHDDGVVRYEQAFHDEQAAYYDELFADPLPMRSYYRRLVTVDIYRLVRRTPFVVDLCCGTGKSSAPLLARGVTVIGMDVSRAMLRKYRDKFPSSDNPVLIHADASRPPLQPRSCGALMMVGGLHHIPDRGGSLRACSEGLADDGVLILHEPLKTGRRSNAERLLDNVYALLQPARVWSAVRRRLAVSPRPDRALEGDEAHALDFTPFEQPFTSPDELLREVPPGMRVIVLRSQAELSFRPFPPALQSWLGRPVAACIVRIDTWRAEAARRKYTGDVLFAVLRKQPTGG